ncbi:hypothetical protein [Plantibacter sp. M259]|uniref:hypothetical protein n=1 Tax=Plantibacter sp. M259 TaxID=2583822 RepID=UPI0011101BA8|nr:hypothetical protein [Plantibacter sp. M259]
MTATQGFSPRRVIGLLVAIGVLTAGTIAGLPARAFAATTDPNAPSAAPTVAVGERLPFSEPRGVVPVVESEIGRGERLGTDPASMIDVSAMLGAGDPTVTPNAILVRIAVLTAESELSVRSGGGSQEPGYPVLAVARGQSASTSVLLPVVSGRINLWSTHPADTRIEVLAVFGDNRLPSPGETIALPEPVTRADTSRGIAATEISAEPVTVGLVGVGGVPSDGVRGVYVTATSTVDAATTLRLDGQSIVLGAGTTSVTTLLTPDETGATSARLTEGSGSFRLDVRGWVAGAGEDFARANVSGGLSPTASSESKSAVIDLGDAPGRQQQVQLGSPRDATHVVALVSAGPAGETTLLDLGPPSSGRARGIIVDEKAGAQPQLVVTPLQGRGVSTLSLGRGQTAASVLTVGEVLGSQAPVRQGARPAITIGSHQPGQSVDLGVNGSVELSGTVDISEASLDRVEVSGPAGLIGNAEVLHDSTGVLTWAYRVSAPEDGLHRYTATAVDRAGHTSTAEISLEVDAVDETDTVVAPDVVIARTDLGGPVAAPLGPPSASPSIAGSDGVVDQAPAVADVVSSRVTFTSDPGLSPGDVLVSEATEQAPDGVFVIVQAADRIYDEWVVTTVPARVEDVFYQADVERLVSLTDPAGILVDDDPETAPEETEFQHEIDEGGISSSILSGEAVDLDDLSEPSDAEPQSSVDGRGALQGAHRDAGKSYSVDGVPLPGAVAMTDGSGKDDEPGDFGISLSSRLHVKAVYDTETKSPRLTDLSKAAGDPKALLQSQFREMTRTQETGLVLSAAAQVGFELTFVLRTHFTFAWFSTSVVVDELTVKVRTKIKAEASVMVFIASSLEHAIRNKVAGFKLPAFTVPVGPVPVVILNSVDVAFKVSMRWQAAVSIPSIGITREDVAGFTYSSGAGSRSLSKAPKITSSPFKPEKLSDVEFKLSGDFAIGPEVSVTSKIYGFAGPEFSVAGQASISGSIKNIGSAVQVEVSLDLLLTFAGRLKVSIARWTLADLELLTLTGKYTLFTRTWELADLDPKEEPPGTPAKRAPW